MNVNHRVLLERLSRGEEGQRNFRLINRRVEVWDAEVVLFQCSWKVSGGQVREEVGSKSGCLLSSGV